MASAQVTLKLSPQELKAICDALDVYHHVCLSLDRGEPYKPNITGTPRQLARRAGEIKHKIGYDG